MLRWLGQSFLSVHVLFHFSSVAALTSGVAPTSQHEYVPGKEFRCLSGNGEVVPFTAVNDNFCDCLDGSDEPGTGACAGQEATLFHCNNEGSTPQLVYSSRVDDGICDCCDGSDEAGIAARHPSRAKCVNSCAEEGAREAVQRAAKIEQLKVGLAKKDEIKAQAAKNRADWQNQINELEKALPALENSVTDAKAVLAKEEEDAKKANATDHLRDEVEALKATVQKLTKKVETLETKLARFEGNREQPVPVADASAGAKNADATGEKKKEVVSEYAKWMDGAGETAGAIPEDALNDEEAEALANEEYGEDGEEGEDEELPGSSATTGTTAGKVASAASVALTDAEKLVRNNKDETKRLNKKLGHISDEAHIGFASLDGDCLSKNDGQYTYKLCFYDDAKQDSVLLGRFDKWTGAKSASFTNGHMCPGGPARQLNIIFECGAEIEVNEVMEPSRCIYETHVSHPGACDEADQADLEKPPVKHPKDEL